MVSRAKSIWIIAVLLLLASEGRAADYPAYLQIGGADSRSRQIASPEIVGVKRQNRAVGMLYFIGSGYGNDATYGPFNLEELLRQGGVDARLNPLNPIWKGKDWLRIYWGESLFGYYRSQDPWVVRKNIQLLTLAGIGYIMFDASNEEAGMPGAQEAANQVMVTIEELQSQGWNPPKACFMFNTNTSANVQKIYDAFYAPGAPKRHPNAWYTINGKPVLVAPSAEIPAAIAPAFTLRETQWPAKTRLDCGWPWIEFDRPQPNYSCLGVHDAISVSVAQHPDDKMSSYPFYGRDVNWGRGYSYGARDHSLEAILRGRNFEEQWSHALAQDLPYTFVTGWNEGGAYVTKEDPAWLGWEGGDITDFGIQDDGSIGGVYASDDPQLKTSQWVDGGIHSVSSVSNNRVSVDLYVASSPAPNPATATGAELRVTTKNGVCLSGEQVTYKPGYQTITFTIPNTCSGIIRTLRLDPPQWGSSDAIAVKKIRLYTDGAAGSTAEWDFSKNERFTEGWTAHDVVSGFGRKSGGTIGGIVTAGDPHIVSPSGLGIDLGANKFIRIRMMNKSSDNQAQLFYSTTTNTVFDEGRSVKFSIKPNDQDFSDYVIDMTNVPSWSGTLAQLRLDPMVNATSGEFKVDHIRIGAASIEAMPAKSWDFGPIHYMYDAADMEFSRDIEPSKGPLGDNYYMQLVDFTRKQTGTEARQFASAPKTIDLRNGGFSQWDDVAPGFKDFTGETDPRWQTGVGQRRYANYTGRNDFELAKVARDGSSLYFYVRTKSNISPRVDRNWMQLLLDIDGDHKNGWNGYDYVVNRKSPSSSTSTNAILERCNGGWSWMLAGTVKFQVIDNQMHLAIPRKLLGGIADPLAIRFKWIDNVSGDAPLSFYTDGDAAPDGRFNYEFVTSDSALMIPKGEVIQAASFSASSAYLAASNVNGGQSFWSTYALAATQEAWIEMDLGSSQLVGGIEIGPRAFNRVGAGFPRDFEFQYKDLNGTWQTVPGMTYRDYPTPGTMPIYFRFAKPISSRNFRWVGTKHRYDDGGATFFMQASSFKVFSPVGLSWEFEHGNDGWASRGTSSVLSASGGMVTGSNTGSDPQMLSPAGLGLKITSISNNQIRIKYRNRSSSKIAQIYFMPRGGQWSEANSKVFPVVDNDGVETEYVVDMSTVRDENGTPLWAGVIDQVRFDPSTSVATGSYSVDYIRIQSSKAPAIAWEFAGYPSDYGGWANANGVGPLKWNSEGSISGDITSPDPQILSAPKLDVAIGDGDFIRVRMRNRTSDDSAQIYFSTRMSPAFDGSKRVNFPIIPNDSEYREYVVKIGDNPMWRGHLSQIRLDPCRIAASGGFDIDWIRIQK